MPSRIRWHAASLRPSSLSSRIFGTIIPGVSTRNIGGSVTILKPEIVFVRHGFDPVRAPLFFPWLMEESRFLRELIMVDFPMLGMPPIITHAPTVLNFVGHESESTLSIFTTFIFSLVLIWKCCNTFRLWASCYFSSLLIISRDFLLFAKSILLYTTSLFIYSGINSISS